MARSTRPGQGGAGLRPIVFLAMTGQVSVASGDVKEVRYSFDGKTWTRAEGAENVSASGFEEVDYATARLDPEAKDRHTKVAVKYLKNNGSDSPVAEFTYDPNESIDRPGVRGGQEDVGTVVYSDDFESAPGSRFPSGPRRRSPTPIGSACRCRGQGPPGRHQCRVAEGEAAVPGRVRRPPARPDRPDPGRADGPPGPHGARPAHPRDGLLRPAHPQVVGRQQPSVRAGPLEPPGRGRPHAARHDVLE